MSERKEKILVTGIGCEGANLKAVRIRDYLKKNNYEISETIENANTCIITTCIAAKRTVDTGINLIDKIKKINPKMRIIIGGCGPKTVPHRFKDFEMFPGYEDVEMFFPAKTVKLKNILFDGSPSEQEKTSLQGFETFFGDKTHYLNLRKIFDRFNKEISNLICPWFTPETAGLDKAYRVIIAQGCNFKCSYCLINKAVGPFRSIAKETIFEDIKRGHDKGHRTFLLVSDEPSMYGTDIYGKVQLKELFDEMFEKFPDAKFSLSYLSTLALENVFKNADLEEYAKHINFLLVPIQTASKKVMKKMNRPWNLEKMKTLILEFRKYYKGSINTQLIYGFPGETDEDIKTTIDYLKDSEFDNIQANDFSPRPGTPLENEEPGIKYTQRYEMLEEAQTFLRTRFLRRLFYSQLENATKVADPFILINSNELPSSFNDKLKVKEWEKEKIENITKYVHNKFDDFSAEILEQKNQTFLKFIIKSKNKFHQFVLELFENEKKTASWFLDGIFSHKLKMNKKELKSESDDLVFFLEKINNVDKILRVKGNAKTLEHFKKRNNITKSYNDYSELLTSSLEKIKDNDRRLCN